METKPARIPLHRAERSYLPSDLIILGLRKWATVPAAAPARMVFIIILAEPCSLGTKKDSTDPPLKNNQHTQRIVVAVTMKVVLEGFPSKKSISTLNQSSKDSQSYRSIFFNLYS